MDESRRRFHDLNMEARGDGCTPLEAITRRRQELERAFNWRRRSIFRALAGEPPPDEPKR